MKKEIWMLLRIYIKEKGYDENDKSTYLDRYEYGNDTHEYILC